MRGRWQRLLVTVPALTLLLACYPVPPLTPPANIRLFGSVNYLIPGQRVEFVVHVGKDESIRSESGSDSLEGQRVEVLLRPQGGNGEVVFTGETDFSGAVRVTFDAPLVEGPAELEVRAQSRRGAPRGMRYPVFLGRNHDVLVTTDKPIYQPGQTIHTRALVLDTYDLRAVAQQPITLTLVDPQGLRLQRRVLNTSQYGIAGADFVLDAEAASGAYRVVAESKSMVMTRTVEVKPYALPRFKVTLQPDRLHYLPGETAAGTVEARYVFGKPLAGGSVVVRAVKTQGNLALAELSGRLDDQGRFAYSFDIPDSVLPRRNDSGPSRGLKANIELHVEVADAAGNTEAIRETLQVLDAPRLVQVAPESGVLRRGLPNLVYISVERPDGTPEKGVWVQLSDPRRSLFLSSRAQTDEQGLAALTVDVPAGADSPFLLTVQVGDAAQERTTHEFRLNVAQDEGLSALVRPNRVQYAVGDTAEIELLVHGKPSAGFISVAKGGQSFAVIEVPVRGNVARASLLLEGSLIGTLDISAFVVDEFGNYAYDRRYILVTPRAAKLDVTPNAETYRPGDTAALSIQARYDDGQPMRGAVGLSIVDESVFGLSEARAAGFARSYFLLRRELQELPYRVRGFDTVGDDDPSPYDMDTTPSLLIAGSQERALAGLFGQMLANAQAAPAAKAARGDASVVAHYAWRVGLATPAVVWALVGWRRRWMLIGLALALVSVILSACVAPASPPSAPEIAQAVPAPVEAPPAEQPQTDVGSGADQQAGAPARLRQFFPETLFWLPELETDENGRASLNVPLADSITTWRVSALVSDLEGRMAGAEIPLKVFQEFFIEPELPRFLTVEDEVAVPVSVFNYTSQPQSVRVRLAPSDWFEFIGEAEATVALAPNDVGIAYLPIRVTRPGIFSLRVDASSGRLGDAVERPVEVQPNGKLTSQTRSGRLVTRITLPVDIPEDALPGTAQLVVRLYPSLNSQLAQSLEGLLQVPYGCLEQTSSLLYVNLMVLEYLRASGQATPELEARAQQFIEAGYQRLLNFRSPRGFLLYPGYGLPSNELSAHLLNVLAKLNQVTYVDPMLIDEAALWLANQQRSDGDWDVAYSAQSNRMRLAMTASATRALAESGYRPRVMYEGVSYIQRAALNESDSYALAWAANALLAAGNDASAVIDALASQARRDVTGAWWDAESGTLFGGYGEAARIETTALAVQALRAAGLYPELIAEAVDWLTAHRDPYGGFHTTQATVQALRALASVAQPPAAEDFSVLVTLRDSQGREARRELVFTEDDIALLQEVRFADLPAGAAELTLEARDADARLLYQAVTRYYLPWESIPGARSGDQGALVVRVDYNRTEVAVNDEISATASVRLLRQNPAGVVVARLSVPPGLTPVRSDLEALVQQGKVARYEVSGRAIALYLDYLEPGEEVTFNYRLRARYPVRAWVPPSDAFDYYTPDQRAESEPQRIIIRLNPTR
ncbi:MAG: MG2 domain-containing protein [Thermoflexales bacterium]|nr:MG2 domain-containing protein [Thermoflexales bacterium]